jgi:hypothetical protein
MLSLVAGTHLHVSDDASSSGIPSRPQPKLDLVGPFLLLRDHHCGWQGTRASRKS